MSLELSAISSTMAQQAPASVMILGLSILSLNLTRKSEVARLCCKPFPFSSSNFKRLIKHSGSLAIGENFTGSCELNGVQNITGYLMTTSTDPDGPEVLWLTSVEAPDLVTLSNLLIARAPAVTSISLPNLSNVSHWSIEGTDGASLNFSAVKSLERLSLIRKFGKYDFPPLTTPGVRCVDTDSYDRMNLPRLEEVTEEFSLCNDASCTIDQAFGIDIAHSPHAYSMPPLSLSFPTLKTGNGMRLAGNITT